MPLLSALFGAFTSEEAREFSSFSLTRGPRLHIILPLIFFGLVVVVIFGWEYYREWKRKRRMRRYWTAKNPRLEQ